jgi:hypothetical protein
MALEISSTPDGPREAPSLDDTEFMTDRERPDIHLEHQIEVIRLELEIAEEQVAMFNEDFFGTALRRCIEHCPKRGGWLVQSHPAQV